VLRRLRPDVVHTNGGKMHVLGTWAAPRGVPGVWHVHDYVGARPVMRRLLRVHARRCAVAIAASASVAEDLRAVCGARLPIHVVHNAIDLARFDARGPVADLDALAAMPAADAGTVRVGLVATLAWWKGHETFLRALALLPHDVPVRGYVVGGPIYDTDGSQCSLDALRARARELGIADRVGFTGFVDDPAAAMRALDVVVHASTRPEPFGLVIAEAMACARAVVVSRAGGAAEITEDGADCLGHSPGDARALAERIHRLAVDAPLRAALGARARLVAERAFPRARLADAMVPIYRAAGDVA
jgi:glycosyltransferase involved in cell wall biosynthesis